MKTAAIAGAGREASAVVSVSALPAALSKEGAAVRVVLNALLTAVIAFKTHRSASQASVTTVSVTTGTPRQTVVRTTLFSTTTSRFFVSADRLSQQPVSVSLRLNQSAAVSLSVSIWDKSSTSPCRESGRLSDRQTTFTTSVTTEAAWIQDLWATKPDL